MLWGPTYVDLFFMDTAFHESMATGTRTVDFGGTEITVIAAEDLTVCKALFNRPHDWVDIQNLVNVQGAAFDRPYVEHWLQHFVGDDPILEQRLAAELRRTHPVEPVCRSAIGVGSLPMSSRATSVVRPTRTWSANSSRPHSTRPCSAGSASRQRAARASATAGSARMRSRSIPRDLDGSWLGV